MTVERWIEYEKEMNAMGLAVNDGFEYVVATVCNVSVYDLWDIFGTFYDMIFSIAKE